MVQVVLHILDGHVMEQSAIYSKDVVYTRLDLFSVSLHDSHVPILQL